MSNEKSLLAFMNEKFLSSRPARPIRILSEYIEPEKKFKEANINHTVVFFGSARTPIDKNDPMSKYYWAAEEFAFQLSSWSKKLAENKKFYICTGGGPGIMEAANRGSNRANHPTIGLNISLPFEQHPNKFISSELNFEFHYFYMRKLWFLYHAKAIIVFPGGFGTMDELFETLTLIQTKKMPEKEDISILLYDQDFWENLINFELFIKNGLISPEDINLFKYFNSPEEGMDLIKPGISKAIEKLNNI